MSATVHNILTKRTIDFSKLQAGQTQDIILCRAIEITGAKQMELAVRTSSKTITGGQIDIIVQAISLTAEDPSVDFLYTTLAGGVIALVTITLNVTAPALQLAQLAGPWGSMVRVIARGTGAAGATIQTSLGIDLIVYDN